jgi:putative endonuclease
MYQVYVLYSPSFDKIYIGHTSDLEARLRSHNEESTKGYTKRYRPWEVVYTENYETRSEYTKAWCIFIQPTFVSIPYESIVVL